MTRIRPGAAPAMAAAPTFVARSAHSTPDRILTPLAPMRQSVGFADYRFQPDTGQLWSRGKGPAIACA